MREARLFAYSKRFDETLKRGAVYWPGETVKKFGLQSANIEPVRVADATEPFEWGELVSLNADGQAVKISGTTTGDGDIYGLVHRNASATYGVLSEQVMGFEPRQTLSVVKGQRDGEFAVPVQTIGSTPVVKNGKVYVRIAESATSPELPIGGIETEEIAGETVEWVGAKFVDGTFFPFKEEKYTDENGATTAVAVITFG